MGRVAWQTVYALLRQVFSDIINCNSFSRNLDFLKQLIILKSLNSELFVFNTWAKKVAIVSLN